MNTVDLGIGCAKLAFWRAKPVPKSHLSTTGDSPDPGPGAQIPDVDALPPDGVPHKPAQARSSRAVAAPDGDTQAVHTQHAAEADLRGHSPNLVQKLLGNSR